MQQLEQRDWIRYANLVTICRVLLLGPTLYGIANNVPLVSLIGFALIVSSDFLDGMLARRAVVANPLGTLFDHSADALVVITLTFIFAQLSLLPVLLSAMIALSFAHYAFDALKTPNNRPRPSSLGKVNGISYFVISALCIIAHHGDSVLSLAQNEIYRSLIWWLAWLLICSTGLSIFQRMQLFNA